MKIVSDALTIYTGGTFDLFHAGHVNLLRRCAEIGEVTVALNTDEFIEEYKGKPPVCSYAEREEVLRACVYVMDVVPNVEGYDSRPTIERVDPDIIAIGTDWARKDYYLQMGFSQEWLDERGIGLLYIPYSWGISTTELKERSASRHRFES